jgi:hypothetical protein
MWFCCACREKVERNIITDREIEERCKTFMADYEDRIKNLEISIAEKCSAHEVKDIVTEEIDRYSKDRGNLEKSEEVRDSGRNALEITTVMSEISERKQREMNIVIYGVPECNSETRDDRIQHDKDKFREICNTCEVSVGDSDISKLIRLGRYVKDKASRPILAALKSTDIKKKLLRGAKNLQNSEGLYDVRIAHDLKGTEREQEKQLIAKAKEMQNNCSGEFRFKIRPEDK